MSWLCCLNILYGYFVVHKTCDADDVYYCYFTRRTEFLCVHGINVSWYYQDVFIFSSQRLLSARRLPGKALAVRSTMPCVCVHVFACSRYKIYSSAFMFSNSFTSQVFNHYNVWNNIVSYARPHCIILHIKCRFTVVNAIRLVEYVLCTQRKGQTTQTVWCLFSNSVVCVSLFLCLKICRCLKYELKSSNSTESENDSSFVKSKRHAAQLLKRRDRWNVKGTMSESDGKLWFYGVKMHLFARRVRVDIVAVWLTPPLLVVRSLKLTDVRRMSNTTHLTCYT